MVSIIFLSFAIAMKVFPAVFLILLLGNKKYKEIIFTLIFVILLTVASLIFHKSGFFVNLDFMLSGFNYNSYSHLCNGNNVIQRGVSLFTLSKMFFIQTNQIVLINMDNFFGLYSKVMFLFFVFLSSYILFIEKEFWKKTMILISVALLFPHVSGDYKLIYIFIPMFLFIDSDKKCHFDLFYIIMFGLLLIPKDYYLFPRFISESGYNDISTGIILNIVIIIAMVVLIIIEGFLKKSHCGGSSVHIKR
jgi:hypothetical protein